MESTFDMQAVVSALVGGGLVTGIAKFYLQKTAEKLEAIPTQLSDIKSDIRAINVHLQDMAELKKLVRDHDRHITYLMGKLCKEDPTAPLLRNELQDR